MIDPRMPEIPSFEETWFSAERSRRCAHFGRSVCRFACYAHVFCVVRIALPNHADSSAFMRLRIKRHFVREHHGGACAESASCVCHAFCKGLIAAISLIAANLEIIIVTFAAAGRRNGEYYEHEEVSLPDTVRNAAVALPLCLQRKQ